ncbi:class I SAM-dependent methyltransferase [Leptolyngbya sp. FACHB-261]|uniref:N5-glutamine methyltransferase family protein n=1 Tax=Leptolyngbya sp. FACHB-261 TaxID=2692806 RepID=UPI0016845027|nr:class I SAM-dependent methyltransferase [Leptolyngbya sp. FACHB-261]MBD2101980.1 class I SAM-dependent methyltransferase [Leptolyngbya sp. FACHB-261]
MKEALLNLEESTKLFSPKEVFFCPEESQFYSHCLDLLVLNRCVSSEAIVEFGCGDGSPIINSLLKTPFKGEIHGYDLNASACKVAQSRIEQYGLDNKYVIHNHSFFEAARPEAEYLIANPPYLPAPDADILMPLLHGGSDGASITKQLLALNYDNVLVMLSSYSNPIDTVEYAKSQDYCIADFMILPLKFGYYSSEPKVKHTIFNLRRKRKAFFSPNIYFLAGVLFKKQCQSTVDLSDELLRVMTVL